MSRFAPTTVARVLPAHRRMLAMVVLLGVGAVLAGVTPAPARAALPPDRTSCPSVNRPGDGLPARRIALTAPGTPGCVLTTATVSVANTGRAVYVAGKALINDAQRPLNKGNRSYVSSVLHCYDSAGASRFGTGAITNIWQGIGNTGEYPRGIFFPPYADVWTCALEVSNHALVGTGHDYYVTDSYLTAGEVAGGWSTPGPTRGGTWPPHAVVAPGTTYANGDKFQVRRVAGAVPPGSTAVEAVATTNLTTCSFNSDQQYCPASPVRPNNLVATVAVHLWIWQQVSDTSTAACPSGTPAEAVWRGAVDSIMHHYTVAQNVTLPALSPDCAPKVVIKTEIENAAGGPAVHIESVNTAAGGFYR
jgi:hypothetical protein